MHFKIYFDFDFAFGREIDGSIYLFYSFTIGNMPFHGPKCEAWNGYLTFHLVARIQLPYLNFQVLVEELIVLSLDNCLKKENLTMCPKKLSFILYHFDPMVDKWRRGESWLEKVRTPGRRFSGESLQKPAAYFFVTCCILSWCKRCMFLKDYGLSGFIRTKNHQIQEES